MAPQPTLNAELERAIEAAKESFSRLPDGDEIFQKCKTGQLSILDVVKAARGSFRNKKSTKRLESLEKHVAWLQGLSSVIDAAVQTKADLMCPVWAPIKFVLKVSNDHSRTTDQILLMLDTIMQGMGHSSLYKDLESDADIDAALLALFKDVVDYCIQATVFFRRSAFKRFISMLAKPYKYEFSQMRDRIREHTTHLHRLVIEKEAIRTSRARDEDRRVRCQAWLRPCSMNEVHQRHIRTRISGTCEWIQKNQIFSEWKSTPSTVASERILCISGVHGCGKSVLASAIFEGMKAEGHNAILFSFSTTDVDRQTANSVVRFLLSRLLSRGLRESVASIHVMLSDERHPSTPQLWELLQDLVRQETQPTFYIFDGLDEASDDRQDIVDGMLKILEQCLESKCLFLGRPQAFDNIPELATSCSRRIEMNQTLTQPDIEVFIDTNIKKLDTLQSQGLRAHASEVLKRNCGSMFLWADLMVKDLAHAYSKHDTMKKLGNLPRDLEAAYKQIFSRLKAQLYPSEQLLLRNILTLVVTARRPLSPLELSWAHALRVSSDLDGEFPVQDFLLDNPENRILHVGRDFFSIYDDRVHLNHSSVKDFLTRNQFSEQSNSETDLQKFHIDLRSANALFADLCLDYLDMEDHGFPIREPDTLEDLRGLHPFMEYASCNFLFHFQGSEIGLSGMTDKLRSLFSSTRVISWLDHLTIAWIEAEFDPSFLLTDSTSTGGSKDQETLDGLTGILRGQLNRELAFRLKAFGEDDARTEHFRTLLPILNFAIGSPLDLHNLWNSEYVDEKRAIGGTSTSSASHLRDTIAAAHAIPFLESAQAINSQRQVSVIIGIASQIRRNFLDPLHTLYRLFLDKALSLPVYAVLGIAMSYHDNDKVEEAFQLCSRILPRVEGRGTLEASWTYLLTGCCLCRLGRYDEAITYLTRGSGRREPNPAMTRWILAESFLNADRVEEGVFALRSIMAKDKKRYGKTHECVAISEGWIGRLLGHQRQYEESLVCYGRALEMAMNAITPSPLVSNPEVIRGLLVDVVEQLDKPGCYREGIAFFERHCMNTLGDHPQWFQADINCFLGRFYFRIREENENFLPRALSHFEKAYLAERECRGKPVLGKLRRSLLVFGGEVDLADGGYESLLEQAWGFLRGSGHSDTEQELRCFREALGHLVRNVAVSEEDVV